MRRAVALLAAALLLAGLAGCGGSGAEPGAPQGATLVLDFTPNAVHTGIYAAEAQGFYSDEGIDLDIHQPGESTDAPKLLAAGRTEFAILDIHDLGIARERGLDLVGVMPIVQRPLAAILANGDGSIVTPKDLEGKTVGVTGLPSDEAVVNSEVKGAGGDPSTVHLVTIGFNAVPALLSGNVEAVTGFWNDEGVTLLQRARIKTFPVDSYGAPPYPELVLAVSEKTLKEKPELVKKVVRATRKGYAFTKENPKRALNDLLQANPALKRKEQEEQLTVLLRVLTPKPFNPRILRQWAAWDYEYGLLPQPMTAREVSRSFVEENLDFLPVAGQ